GRLAGLLLLGGGRGARCRGGQGVIQQLAHIARDRGQGDDEGDHHHDGTADDDPLRLQRALLPVPRAHRERPGGVVVHGHTDHVTQQRAAGGGRGGGLLRRLLEHRAVAPVDHDRPVRPRRGHGFRAPGDRYGGGRRRARAVRDGAWRCRRRVVWGGRRCGGRGGGGRRGRCVTGGGPSGRRRGGERPVGARGAGGDVL